MLAVEGQRLRVALADHDRLGSIERTGQKPSGQEIDDPVGLVGSGIAQGQRGQVARGLHELRIVECGQRLERRVGALASDAARLATRGVEEIHQGRR